MFVPFLRVKVPGCCILFGKSSMGACRSLLSLFFLFFFFCCLSPLIPSSSFSFYWSS